MVSLFYWIQVGKKLLAKRLDELNIEWVRPKEPIIWIDSKNDNRNYFPDFYLLKYDIYLDPKNPYAFEVQKEKIDYLLENFSNIKFITSLQDVQNYAPMV